MNRLCFCVLSIAALALLSILASQSGATDGKAVFESLHCGSCHKPDIEKTGTSLKQVARTYGDQSKLVAYLEGKSEPIIEPEKQAVMRGQLKKIAKLTGEERQALADYILSFK